MSDNHKNTSSSAGGISFLGLLTIVFIVMKLTGHIGWSWVWVLAPIWIPAALVVVILFVALLVMVVKEVERRGRR
jgi:MFS superfamily sulfate permease-like transporter